VSGGDHWAQNSRPSQLANQREPVAVGQVTVEQDEIDGLRVDLPPGPDQA